MSVSFGDAIRRGREVAGLSQARVAQLVGKSATTVRSWELGRSHPGEAAAVSALAAVLGMDETALLHRAGFELEARPQRPSVTEELSSLAAARTETLPPIPMPPSSLLAPAAPIPMAPPGTADSEGVRPPEVGAGAVTITTARHLGPRRPRPARSATRPVRPPPGEQPVRTRKVTAVAPTSGPIPIPASTLARSYLEDPEQRDFYKQRAVATGVIMVFLVMVLWWAIRNTGEAIGDLTSTLIDSLNI